MLDIIIWHARCTIDQSLILLVIRTVKVDQAWTRRLNRLQLGMMWLTLRILILLIKLNLVQIEFRGTLR